MKKFQIIRRIVIFLAFALLAAAVNAEEQISDTQLLAAKENTLRVTRMAAQMGAISPLEAAEIERKVAPMTAQEFKTYLEAETAKAQNSQETIKAKIDEQQLKALMEQYKDLLPTATAMATAFATSLATPKVISTTSATAAPLEI